MKKRLLRRLYEDEPLAFWGAATFLSGINGIMFYLMPATMSDPYMNGAGIIVGLGLMVWQRKKKL